MACLDNFVRPVTTIQNDQQKNPDINPQFIAEHVPEHVLPWQPESMARNAMPTAMNASKTPTILGLSNLMDGFYHAA
jgi:hypothetical protein